MAQCWKILFIYLYISHLYRKSPGVEKEFSSGVWDPVQWVGGEGASVSSQQPGVRLWEHIRPGLEMWNCSKAAKLFCCVCLWVSCLTFGLLEKCAFYIICYFCRCQQDLGTTTSFLPSSQETTLYSLRATPFYSTNWPKVSTSAQSVRFVTRFSSFLLVLSSLLR